MNEHWAALEGRVNELRSERIKEWKMNEWMKLRVNEWRNEQMDSYINNTCLFQSPFPDTSSGSSGWILSPPSLCNRADVIWSSIQVGDYMHISGSGLLYELTLSIVWNKCRHLFNVNLSAYSHSWIPVVRKIKKNK